MYYFERRKMSFECKQIEGLAFS